MLNYNVFQPRVINCVTGYQGAGKTAFLTLWALLYAHDEYKKTMHNASVAFLKNNNYRCDNKQRIIPSYNIELNGRFMSNEKFDADNDILNIFDYKKFIAEHTMLILDEAQDKFNSRFWQQTGREAARFCEFARHFNLMIVFSCQDFFMLDKTFRAYSKIYFIDACYIIDVYGKKHLCTPTSPKVKAVDISKVVYLYHTFENAHQYEKFFTQNALTKTLTQKKIEIEANIFDMYNSSYLKTEFMKKNDGKK